MSEFEIRIKQKGILLRLKEISYLNKDTKIKGLAALIRHTEAEMLEEDIAIVNQKLAEMISEGEGI